MAENTDWPNEHANQCDHCRHPQKDSYRIIVTFDLNVERGHIPPNQDTFIDALIDGLPKEWWWGSNMADWGLVKIS